MVQLQLMSGIATAGSTGAEAGSMTSNKVCYTTTGVAYSIPQLIQLVNWSNMSKVHCSRKQQ